MKLIIVCLLILISSPSFSVPNWTQRADFAGGGRHRAASFQIGTKGYLGIGHYNGTGVNIVLKDWWEYDPSTNAWTQKADYIGNNGNGNYATLSFSFNDEAYLGGGALGSSEFYKYTPGTNSWTQVTAPPIKPVNTEGFVLENSGYFIRFGNLWEYNRNNDQWANRGAVPFSVNSWNSGFSLNGKGYIKTGNQLWEYKPLTNQWAMRAPFPGLATGGSGTFVQNGKAYIVTGYAGSLSQVNSEVWEYNPNSNSWWRYANFPGSNRRFSCTFNIGDKSFISTGTNGTNFSDLWEFILTVGVNDLSYDNSFTAYPNPAKEKIRFQSEQYTNAFIKIYSIDGNLVKEIKMTSNQVTFYRENIQNGTYFYHVEVDNQIIHANKFIFI